MDPISAAMGVIGLGMQIYGTIGATETAEKQAQVSRDEATQEQGINDVRQRAMETDARRQSLEIMRKNQQAQALATSRATNQGAQFGTGLQGGLAEVQSSSAFNLEGVNNALQTGRDINSFNRNISNDKMQMASLGGDAAAYAGWSSLGGAMIKAGPISGQVSKGFGSLNLGNAFMGGGSPSGYGTS